MKGIILAGGLGTRLYPLTKITNKHLLPVYNKPMIYYPIETLVEAGIKDIMIVCGGRHAGEFLRLLGNGSQFGLRNLEYAYQEDEKGIADALRLTEEFVDGDKMVVFLGDNFIEDDLQPYVRSYRQQEEGAKLLLKEVENPEDYGIVKKDANGDIEKIIEKPESPPTNLAVVGIYFYDPKVFEFIDRIEPSQRGEYEISDVNNLYLREDKLMYNVLDGWWADAGASIEAYYETFKIAHSLQNS